MKSVYVLEVTTDGAVTRGQPFDTWAEAAKAAKHFRFPQAVVRELLVHPDGFLVERCAVVANFDEDDGE